MLDNLRFRAATSYQNPARKGPLAGALLTGLLVLAGCQATKPPPGTEAPAAAQAPALRQAPALPEAPAYDVDYQASEVRVLVYRGGALAKLGHNHVMVAPLHGELRAGTDTAHSGFHLEFRVDELDVDPVTARAEEGEAFATTVSDQARKGTRTNMLGERLLDAEQFPHVEIDSVSLEGPLWNPDVTANVTLHGTTATLTFPAAVVAHDDTLTAIARVPLAVSDFGIEPFSILGGGLQVEDRLDVRVRVVAKRRSGE